MTDQEDILGSEQPRPQKESSGQPAAGALPKDRIRTLTRVSKGPDGQVYVTREIAIEKVRPSGFTVEECVTSQFEITDGKVLEWPLRLEPENFKSDPRPEQPPATARPAPPEELKSKDGTVLAILVKKNRFYVVTPKVKVAETIPSFTKFLLGGEKNILPNIATRHPRFTYSTVFDKGVLLRLELSGVTDDLWKQVQNAIVWALDRARDTKS